MYDEITQEDACNHEIDTRMEQCKIEEFERESDELTCDPFTVEKMQKLITRTYGSVFPIEHVSIWFENYKNQNINGNWIEPIDFVNQLYISEL